MARPSVWILVWIFLALLSLEIYSLIPYSEKKKDFFWFADQELTLQVWVDYGSTRLGILILLFQLQRTVLRYQRQLLLAFLLFAGYTADYFLRYNLPIEGTFLSYTLFMLIGMFLIIALTVWSERKSL